ncbi:hypothetical protein METP3_01224 [Methanosarcinales archaeon]|nr:hypothetical protein METP3_01224 [Methanosarcinales archaeon]
MVNVSRKWIKENVEQLSAFGNQITLDNFEEYVKGQKSLSTNLTRRGIELVEGHAHKKKFLISIPGAGWADCWGYYPDWMNNEENDYSHFY